VIVPSTVFHTVAPVTLPERRDSLQFAGQGGVVLWVSGLTAHNKLLIKNKRLVNLTGIKMRKI